MTTGAILRQLRVEKDVGQKEVAVYLNVSIATVSNYENGVHSPDYKMLCLLADYYNVTTDYLLGRTDCRSDARILSRRISEEYTIADVIEAVLVLDSSGADQLMEYAQFLLGRSKGRKGRK